MNDGHATPPRWVFRVLRWYCPDHLAEEIEGDLEQLFQRDVQTKGGNLARQKFFWNVIRFLRPGILFRNRFDFNFIRYHMILNNIIIALRNFNRHRSFTGLNIIGLSLGITASILIFQYVRYERSFDAFHERADDIYRMQYNWWSDGKLTFECAAAVPAAGPAIARNFPEVEAFARLYPVSGVIAYDDPGRGLISFFEEKMQVADPAIFDVFDFEVVEGDPASVLEGPNKVMVSERAARKYFGDKNAIGQRLDLNNRFDLEVSGVFADVPENSHIKFDFLISYETLNQWSENESEKSWGWYDFNTYVLLKPGSERHVLQAKWNTWLEANRKEDWDKYNSKQEFILQPLRDIHLNSDMLQESQPEEQRDGDAVYALSVIAVFILLIAWVNYINLATARSFDRANEVGVRKVMGAFQSQLVNQFLTESFLLNALAVVVSILLVLLLWTPFSHLTGWNIPVDFIKYPDFWTLVAMLFIGGTLLSGFYPAIVLSSFKPVSVLKGKVVRSSKGNILRKGLVVFQFVASVFLISGSLIIYKQLKFMNSQDLGIDINETLVLRGPQAVDSLYSQNLEGFKNEALRISGVKNISASSNVPGNEIFWTNGIRRLSGGAESNTVAYIVGIDADYVPSFGLNLLAGQNFDPSTPLGEARELLINRAMAETLEYKNLESAIGERVILGGDTLMIRGILDNYHQMSLKNMISPLVFRLVPASRFYALKVESADVASTLEGLQQEWSTFFPGNPFDYFYLDQFFNRQYDKDDRLGHVFGIFTLLAIFISCLGLFGLASFMTVQRTKEIGIRKVLGSTAPGIVLLLSKGFVQLVIIANFIAWPLTWWVMDKWLQEFPYRTEIGWMPFMISAVSVILIALLSVGSQTFKAALLSPAKTLKYE